MQQKNLRNLLISLISRSSSPEITADMIIDALREEGVLNVGFGDSDVNAITSKFSEVFGNTKTTKQDRSAAVRLGKKYGVKTVIYAINALAANIDRPYVPVVNSVAQLETKWVSVMNFLRANVQIEKPLDT